MIISCGAFACFCGTVANVAKESYKELSSGLKPDANSPTERWFLAIRKGDVPQASPIADITREWIEEFAREHRIELPKYKIISSVELPAAFA